MALDTQLRVALELAEQAAQVAGRAGPGEGERRRVEGDFEHGPSVSERLRNRARTYPPPVAAHAETSRRFLPSFGWIRAYSELTTTLLRRELRVKYKGSSLGILWSYVYPLAMVAVYTLVFSVLWHAVKGIPHYPLFVLVGIAVWTFFQSAVQISAGSIVANAHLIRNVRFPREVIPAATVLSQAVASIVMFCVLVPVSLIVVPESAKTVILTV